MTDRLNAVNSTIEACLEDVHRGRRPATDFVQALAGASLWLLAAPTLSADGRSGTRFQLLPDPGHDDQRLIAGYLTRARALAAAGPDFSPLAMPVATLAKGANAKLGLLIDPGAAHALRLAPEALALLRT